METHYHTRIFPSPHSFLERSLAQQYGVSSLHNHLVLKYVKPTSINPNVLKAGHNLMESGHSKCNRVQLFIMKDISTMLICKLGVDTDKTTPTSSLIWIWPVLHSASHFLNMVGKETIFSSIISSITCFSYFKIYLIFPFFYIIKLSLHIKFYLKRSSHTFQIFLCFLM